MLKLLPLLVLVGNFNIGLTDTIPLEDISNGTVLLGNSTDENSDSQTRIRCGPNQIFDFCPICPPRTCKNKDLPDKCIKPLELNVIFINCPRPRCRCADGYFSTDDGKCVLKEKCPIKCGLNEVPSDCGNNPCLPTCARPDLDTYCRPNPASCKPGCVCAEGYIRDEKGVCILKDKCPTPKCNENEEYSTCPNNVCRVKNCSEVGYTLPCESVDLSVKNATEITIYCGKPKCICKDGYVKNGTGVCIPIRECPSCGGDPNAWSGCGTFCNRCNKTIPCPRICYPNKCDCRDGYTYDATKMKCVLPEQCPPQCGRNEVPSECANNPCQPTCEKPDLSTYCRPKPDDCKLGCVCADGYVRDKNGTCVSIHQCPAQCNENEEYSTCPNNVCRVKTCGDVGYPLPCESVDLSVKNTTEIIIYCGKPQCICKEGYVRNDTGVCIPVRECPSCAGDPNAWSGCGTFCNRCNKTIPCPRVCYPNRCDCRDGYDYDEIKKKCVLPEQCPPQCRRNEVPSECANNPCLSTCEKPDLITYCRPNPANCKPGCVCADGYVRDKNGTCVPIDQCPVQCKENEEYSTCPNNVCRVKICKEVGYPLPCELSIDISLKNSADIYCEKPKCICKDGYVRNDAGVCIPVRECPSCGGDPNAWSGCGTFCNRCNKTIKCPRICFPNRCDCRDGYVYDGIKDKCVLPEQCPPKCGLNEVASECATDTCLPTCEKPELLYCKLNVANCTPGCVCAEGYLRDKNGTCVPKDKCPPKRCTGEHEYFACSNECDNECDKLHYQNHTNCPILNVKCNEKCYCLDGYARNAEGKCIPISQCPPICKQNEEYANCTNQVCQPQSCKDLGYPLPCYNLDRINTECGKPGCICQSGFVRNEEGVCIPERNCTSCGGDPNAWSGCGTYCTRCTNYRNPYRACILSCFINRCDCRTGYVLDEIKNKCVLPEECPCGTNEVTSDCANSPCIKTCASKDLNLLCKPYPSGCKPGCVCAKGYLRDDYGTCVPIEKCPTKGVPIDVIPA